MSTPADAGADMKTMLQVHCPILCAIFITL